jgi:gluconolactonase
MRSLLPLIGAVAVSLSAVAPAAPPAEASSRGDGPAPAAKPFSVTRLDAAFDSIFAPDATLELLADNFRLNEGPVWVPDDNAGFLLVSGLLDNVLYRVDLDGTVSVFMEKAGYTGDDPLTTGTQTRAGRSHVLLIGPSCTGLDSKGRLVWCADNDRALMRLESDGTRTVLSSGDNGKTFSGPNDIAIAADDRIYLTDNDFGLRGAGASPDKQMPNGVWLIKEGTSRRLLDDVQLGGVPNGIALSPDEKYLYLTARPKIWRYEILADGSLGDRTLFSEGPGIGDGMKVDIAGNLYATSGSSPGIVRVMDKTGKVLGYLHMPEYGREPKRQSCATNIAFGEEDHRSMFITACDAVYKIRTKIPGTTSGPGH